MRLVQSLASRSIYYLPWSERFGLLRVSINDLLVPKSRLEYPFETQDAYDNLPIFNYLVVHLTPKTVPLPPGTEEL